MRGWLELPLLFLRHKSFLVNALFRQREKRKKKLFQNHQEQMHFLQTKSFIKIKQSVKSSISGFVKHIYHFNKDWEKLADFLLRIYQLRTKVTKNEFRENQCFKSEKTA